MASALLGGSASSQVATAFQGDSAAMASLRGLCVSRFSLFVFWSCRSRSRCREMRDERWRFGKEATAFHFGRLGKFALTLIPDSMIPTT
jgi:hypothetical protein